MQLVVHLLQPELVLLPQILSEISQRRDQKKRAHEPDLEIQGIAADNAGGIIEGKDDQRRKRESHRGNRSVPGPQPEAGNQGIGIIPDKSRFIRASIEQQVPAQEGVKADGRIQSERIIPGSADINQDQQQNEGQDIIDEKEREDGIEIRDGSLNQEKNDSNRRPGEQERDLPGGFDVIRLMPAVCEQFQQESLPSFEHRSPPPPKGTLPLIS